VPSQREEKKNVTNVVAGGHYAIVCPTQDKKFTLICKEDAKQTEDTEDSAIDKTPRLEESEGPDETLHGSTLPICVIRLVLAGQHKCDEENEDWCRSNIFHTRVEFEPYHRQWEWHECGGVGSN
jgi:hypothetical protein